MEDSSLLPPTAVICIKVFHIVAGVIIAGPSKDLSHKISDHCNLPVPGGQQPFAAVERQILGQLQQVTKSFSEN
ncbi:hypothetical protein TURU_121437 [Turdus rufiventris]|nr:hypothetical protein TURU_121437 [Turdus rufiventris]